MPRPFVGLLVIPCLLVQSTHFSYQDGFAGQYASEKIRHVPRGGETTQESDELFMTKARDQPWYPFSLISAFRVLHRKSMLVKEDEEEDKLEFLLGDEEEKDEPNSAAVEMSSSFAAKSVDDDETRSSNVHAGYLTSNGGIKSNDSQMADITGKTSTSAHYSQHSASPSKSRRTHRNIAETKTARQDRRRQSRSHRIGSSNGDSSIILEDGKIGKERCLDENMENFLHTGLDGKVLSVLDETNAPPTGKDDCAIPLYNHSAECRESLYISSGHVSIMALPRVIIISFHFYALFLKQIQPHPSLIDTLIVM